MVRFWLFKMIVVAAGRKAVVRCRKKGQLGHYKKRIFRPLLKCGIFALFENRQKTPASVNKDGHLVKAAFWVFVPKRVKNRVKKNIASNLP